MSGVTYVAQAAHPGPAEEDPGEAPGPAPPAAPQAGASRVRMQVTC